MARVVDRAKEGIQRATDVADVKKYLANLVDFLRIYQQKFSQHNISHSTKLETNAFVEYHYHNLVEFLFDRVVAEWLLCFSETERRELFDIFFLPIESNNDGPRLKTLVPPVYSFLSLACLLAPGHAQYHTEELVSLQMKPGNTHSRFLDYAY